MYLYISKGVIEREGRAIEGKRSERKYDRETNMLCTSARN